jgi:hypothetical protein
MCGAMANWYDDKAERLSNDEAYTLLNDLLCPTLPNGAPNTRGSSFRASLEYFREQGRRNDYKSGWIVPPDKYRLPIDGVIADLVQKNSSPRIDTTRQGALPFLRMYGPYELVRSHLEFSAARLPNFEVEASVADTVKERISLFEEAFDRLADVLNVPHWEIANRQVIEERRLRNEEKWEQNLPPESISNPTNTQAIISKHMETIISAAESLIDLREIAKKESSLIWVNEEKAGRKKQLWTQSFVVRIAHLWVLLTGARPSVSADSPFATFVRECWNSYDENMPQVSFDRAIRNLTILG